MTPIDQESVLRLLLRKGILVLVTMVAFLGLWHLLAPYRGPANSFLSGDTAEIMRGGGRIRCSPALFTMLSDPLEGDGSEKLECMEVGAIRIHIGVMLLLTAGVGAIASTFMLGTADQTE